MAELRLEPIRTVALVTDELTGLLQLTIAVMKPKVVYLVGMSRLKSLDLSKT